MYGEWIVDLSRFLDYQLFLNICSVSSWLNIIEHLLCAFVYFFPVPQKRTCFLKNHLKCLASEITFLNVKECVVYVCSLCFITEWLNGMYIHGFNFCYRPRNHHPTCSFIVLVWNLNNVSMLFGWYSIIPRQNLSRIGWFLGGFIYVCKRKWHYLTASEYEKWLGSRWLDYEIENKYFMF